MKFIKFCGALHPCDEEAFDFWCEIEEGTEVIVKQAPKKRTARQNRAMHGFFTELARVLNDCGMYIHVFPWNEGAEVEWRPEDTKSRLWVPLQEAITGKRHTSDLETHEVNAVYEPFAKKLADNGVQVPPMGIE